MQCRVAKTAYFPRLASMHTRWKSHAAHANCHQRPPACLKTVSNLLCQKRLRLDSVAFSEKSHKFQSHLEAKYVHAPGNSALGIDFPGLEVDLKVTSVRQPQSSCPFKSARQKIYGLGYSLLVFVYDKTDDETTRSATLNILHSVFIESRRTADYQTTRGLLDILERGGNEDDIIAFLSDRMLPVEEIEMRVIAQDLLKWPPELGYLTISNALQWRLQYGRVIQKAGTADGITRIR